MEFRCLGLISVTRALNASRCKKAPKINIKKKISYQLIKLEKFQYEKKQNLFLSSKPKIYRPNFHRKKINICKKIKILGVPVFTRGPAVWLLLI